MLCGFLFGCEAIWVIAIWFVPKIGMAVCAVGHQHHPCAALDRDAIQHIIRHHISYVHWRGRVEAQCFFDGLQGIGHSFKRFDGWCGGADGAINFSV